jgi:hypothetical protein
MTNLQNLLLDIENYNAELYSSYKPGEKIDFSKSKKNCGKNIIPSQFWIDTTKEYITKNGWKVENLQIIMENSNGNEVTFPVKGTYIEIREGKSDKKHYSIWTLDGRKDINKLETDLDLILKY